VLETGIVPRLMKRFSGGFVLAFHEMPPKRLAEFVDCLRPAQPVSLTDLVLRNKSRKSTSGLFAITIDDGTGDNVRDLARLFLAREWPATFYLPTDYLETGESMAFQWWRRLQPHLPQRRLELPSGSLDLSPSNAVRDLSRKMEMLWHSTRLESYVPRIMELVEFVACEGGVSRAALQPAPPVGWSEVEQLSKTDLIRFESHGVTHTAMSALTPEELVCEMQRSRDLVTERSGRPCRHLAYPFGSPLSIGAVAADIARRFYDSASTMSLGGVDRANPLLLPRIPLYTDNSTFCVRLKVLLKYSPPSTFGRIAPPWEDGASTGPRPSRVEPVEDV
jgi:peptidoglycan/xylan/chitin deacetylase (PgdA/CDA1 family)